MTIEEDHPADGPAPDQEKEEAAARDREGGRQFGRVMMIFGAAGIALGLYMGDADYLVFGGVGVLVLGAIAHRWPVEIVRLFTGMGDKL